MQVDVVRHRARRVVLEMKLDEMAFANADERTRHFPAERPCRVLYAVREPKRLLDDLEIHDHPGRMRAGDRRRHIGRVREHRDLLSADVVARMAKLDDPAPFFFAGRRLVARLDGERYSDEERGADEGGAPAGPARLE